MAEDFIGSERHSCPQGTLNNCGAGITPWGTVLTAEENFQQYFGGSVEAISDQTVQALHKRYGVQDEYGWARHYDRFDVTKEPHEPFRFGWVVEIDPYDPAAIPGKAYSSWPIQT